MRTISHRELMKCKLVADKVGGMPENKGVRLGDTIYLNPKLHAMIEVAAPHELPSLLEGLIVLDFTEMQFDPSKPIPLTAPSPRPITELDFLNLWRHKTSPKA